MKSRSDKKKVGDRILECHMLAGGKHKSSLQTMEDVQQLSDGALIEICLSWKAAHTFSLLISLSVSVCGPGMAFLPASISYLIGTNIFGTLAHKMGR